MNTLFDHEPPPPSREPLEEGAMVLRGFATDVAALVAGIERIAAAAPFRHMVTPGGHKMSVAMTNCGRMGWVSSAAGYSYEPVDPTTGRPWPAMPECFLDLARRAAGETGFPGYDPDACLVNRYAPGAKLGLHQDRDEHDPVAPIVSVSIGLTATFIWGGKKRHLPVRRFPLVSGDVVVWGGPARFAYHGVAPLKYGDDPLTGALRYNLTFRKVF